MEKKPWEKPGSVHVATAILPELEWCKSLKCMQPAKYNNKV